MNKIKDTIIAIIVLIIIIITIWFIVKPKEKKSIVPNINTQIEEIEDIKKNEIKKYKKEVEDLKKQITIFKQKKTKSTSENEQLPLKEKEELMKALNAYGY
jgi:predicted PurR-regulated permease PerM